MRAPRIHVGQYVVERTLRVHDGRIDLRRTWRARKARARRVAGEGALAHQSHQVFGVAAIVNGELARQADGLGIFAQQACADAVERSRTGQRGRAGVAPRPRSACSARPARPLDSAAGDG